MTDEREHGAREVLERIIRLATSNAHSRGYSSMEVAASVVSYLAAHLDLVPGFTRGIESPNSWPPDWCFDGDLTWHGSDERHHNSGEDISDGRASGALSENAAIVSWLRGKAREHRRQSDDAGYGLAARLDHERHASLIDEIAHEIDQRKYHQPLGRSIA